MPLIPNYIARFRTHSQSTAVSASSHSGTASNSTAGPSTPGGGPEVSRLTTDPPAGQISTGAEPAPEGQIARKIHPDISALLNENAAADAAADVPGPRPPKGRSRSAGHLASKMPEGVLPKETAVDSEEKVDAEPPEADKPDPSSSTRSPFLSRILSTPILGGMRTTPATPARNPDAESDAGQAGAHWSTFGRRRLRSPAIGDFGSLHRRGSSQSKTSERPIQRGSAPVTPSTTRAPSRVPTAADTPPSQSDSPAGTVSSASGSKAYSQHSQSVRSRRLPHNFPEPIPDIEPSSSNDPQTPKGAASSEEASMSPFTPLAATVSPRLTKQHLDGSPQTFGRVTPQRPAVGSKTVHEFSDLSPSTHPSMPSSAEHHPRGSKRQRSSTYPSRSRMTSRNTINFPSLPSKTSAASQPRTRAEDLFKDADFGRLPDFLGVRSKNGDGSGRRTSADWIAAEAVRHGNADKPETWPAAVSKEMVRLSLGDRNGGGIAVQDSGESADHVVKGRGGRPIVRGPNPTLFGSTGDEQRQFIRLGRRTYSAGSATRRHSSPSRRNIPRPLGPALLLTSETSTSSSKPAINTDKEKLGENLVPHVSVTGPTPSASPSGSKFIAAPGPDLDWFSGIDFDNISKSHGKRKQVESEDEEQTKEPGTRPILLHRRETSKHSSDASHAPSSFRHVKRIRLSTPTHSPPHDHPSSSQSSPPASPGSRPPSSLRNSSINVLNPRTLSQTSIPIRAIVSPKPPSVDTRSNYHMRDPALPPSKRQSTQWTGGARKVAEDRRLFPLQGWAFVVGFLIFPLWWIAAFVPVKWGWRGIRAPVPDEKTSMSQEDLAAREVTEYDVACTWRQRCRLMSVFGLLVYVPLIVLLTVFVPQE